MKQTDRSVERMMIEHQCRAEFALLTVCDGFRISRTQQTLLSGTHHIENTISFMGTDKMK